MIRLVPHPLAMRRGLTVSELFDALDGVEVEGGCGDCAATQRIERIRHLGRVTMITVLHDDSCPALARRGGGR